MPTANNPADWGSKPSAMAKSSTESKDSSPATDRPKTTGRPKTTDRNSTARNSTARTKTTAGTKASSAGRGASSGRGGHKGQKKTSPILCTHWHGSMTLEEQSDGKLPHCPFEECNFKHTDEEIMRFWRPRCIHRKNHKPTGPLCGRLVDLCGSTRFGKTCKGHNCGSPNCREEKPKDSNFCKLCTETPRTQVDDGSVYY